MAYLSKSQQVRSNTHHKTNHKKLPKKVPTPKPEGKKICACGCGKKYNLSIHHVYYGSGKRKLSSIYKCVEWLEWSSHQSSIGIHGSKTPNYRLDHELKIKHQIRLMSEGMSLKEFISLFGGNYEAMTTEEFIEKKLEKERYVKLEFERA